MEKEALRILFEREEKKTDRMDSCNGKAEGGVGEYMQSPAGRGSYISCSDNRG